MTIRSNYYKQNKALARFLGWEKKMCFCECEECKAENHGQGKLVPEGALAKEIDGRTEYAYLCEFANRNPKDPEVTGYGYNTVPSEMKFSWDWNWLMPVIELLEQSGHVVTCYPSGTKWRCVISAGLPAEGSIGESKIEAMYLECVRVIM
jgi:hypothetical protein